MSKWPQQSSHLQKQNEPTQKSRGKSQGQSMCVQLRFNLAVTSSYWDSISSLPQNVAWEMSKVEY